MPIYDLRGVWLGGGLPSAGPNLPDDSEIRLEEEEEKLLDWEPGKESGALYCNEEEDGKIDRDPYDNTRDSVTGDLLPPDLVQKAHGDEIDFMSEWKIE